MTSSEDTPIADELEENLTHYEEDDDPLSLAGDFVEDADPEDGN